MSNRLPVLAEEIGRQHVMCVERGKAFVESAIEAGNLLIEAKGIVQHGEWNDWLQTNVPNVSVRTAQRYMRAARSAGEKRQVSLLSLRHLTRPTKKPAKPRMGTDGLPASDASMDELWEWVDWQCRAPLNRFDLDNLSCLRRKLIEQAGVPMIPNFLLGVETDLPMLTLASDGDLHETLGRLVPIAQGEGEVSIDYADLTSGSSPKDAATAIQCMATVVENMATALCGLVIKEIERRADLATKSEPDTYKRELQDRQAQVLTDWMASLDAEIAKFELRAAV